MSNKLNGAFLNNYIELDKICSVKFGTVSGGVTEYINRLINARFAPDRDEVLVRLVRYRNIRNKIAHEEGTSQGLEEISRADIRWIDNFKKELNKKKDPISVYLRRARSFARRRRAWRAFSVSLTILLILGGAAAAVYFFLLK